jgi:hypothetical protein
MRRARIATRFLSIVLRTLGLKQHIWFLFARIITRPITFVLCEDFCWQELIQQTFGALVCSNFMARGRTWFCFWIHYRKHYSPSTRRVERLQISNIYLSSTIIIYNSPNSTTFSFFSRTSGRRASCRPPTPSPQHPLRKGQHPNTLLLRPQPDTANFSIHLRRSPKLCEGGEQK